MVQMLFRAAEKLLDSFFFKKHDFSKRVTNSWAHYTCDVHRLRGAGRGFGWTG